MAIRTKNALMLPSGFAITLFQAVVVSIYRQYLKVRGGFTADIRLPTKIKHTQRYVLAANHQMLADPFAIFATVPLAQRLRFLPLKFMTIPKVYHRWYFKPFAYLLGCYPAHIKEHRHHTYGVVGTIKLLNYGYNVCIFPEGKRTTPAESDPKPGIVRILQAVPDATLILAHLQWRKDLKGKRRLTMVVAPAPENLDKSDAKAIMDAIYRL